MTQANSSEVRAQERCGHSPVQQKTPWRGNIC